MKKYLILKLDANVYERFAEVKELECGRILNLMFTECTEDIVPERASGKIIESNLYLWDAGSNGLTSDALTYSQPIPNSGHTEAVVEITQIINERTMLAKSTISTDDITIEFLDAQSYSVGDRVLVHGSLSFGEMIP